jgi:hypothetical protein
MELIFANVMACRHASVAQAGVWDLPGFHYFSNSLHSLPYPYFTDSGRDSEVFRVLQRGVVRHDAVLPVKISENLREGMFDEACFGQYSKFQADILGDIETDMMFREICRNGEESKLLLL